MIWLQLGVGLFLLLGGGEALVRGSVSIAHRLGVSPLLIGLTLVGFGTSMPELVASVEAALLGAPGIAIGNVVGSNIANILLILGIAAIVFPVATSKNAFQRDGAVLIGASLLLLGAVLTGSLSSIFGAILVALLAAYMVYTYRTERNVEAPQETVLTQSMPLSLAIILTIGGIIAVVAGAAMLVKAAVIIAENAGISQAVIGVTLVAVGTSLPELAASLMAALRRQGDVAFGNIVGSNIFNILGIAGITAIVSPIAIPAEIGNFDIWVMLGAAGLLVVFAITGWRITRTEGVLFLAAYAAYIVLQFSPAARQLIATI